VSIDDAKTVTRTVEEWRVVWDSNTNHVGISNHFETPLLDKQEALALVKDILNTGGVVWKTQRRTVTTTTTTTEWETPEP
jgi:hypothetical protein